MDNQTLEKRNLKLDLEGITHPATGKIVKIEGVSYIYLDTPENELEAGWYTMKEMDELIPSEEEKTLWDKLWKTRQIRRKN